MIRKRTLVIEQHHGMVRVKNGDGVNVSAGSIDRALQKAADATGTSASLDDIRSGKDAAEFIDTLLGKFIDTEGLQAA